ncbi:hypothetical protein [Sandaracinobacteroides hominis]|uniref:hypothetical protein n=1 Tax=Sandaracinobacteroides hominis TaxID=2780086 RepID=UPI0018F3FEFB|nr:hypothetical protein [Sandaracinobacteroides hominis]
MKSQRQVLARFTSAQVPASGIWMFNIPQWVVDQILSAFPNFDQTLLTIETLHRHIPGSPATTWGWEYQISNVGAGRDEDGNALVVTGGWVKTAATRKPFSQASAELDMLPLDLEQ